MKELRTDAEIKAAFNVGDIVSFPPYADLYKVLDNDPLTIKPVSPVRVPLSWLVPCYKVDNDKE
jgi:hypothetical protein